MTLFLNRIFTFLLLVGIVMPIGQSHAVWEQPPHSFAPADGANITMGSDANGNAIVVLDNEGDVEAYFYSTVTNAWSGPTILGTNNQQILMKMHPSGTALAVWVDPDNLSIHSAFFNGTVWTLGSPDPFAVASDVGVGDITLDMNGPNTALFTWFDVIGPGSDIYYSNFFSAGTWGTAIPIGSPASFGPSNGEYSENGTAIATFTNAANALLVSNFIGGVWQAPVTLDPTLPFANHNVVAGIDAIGRAVVLWVTTGGDVVASTFNGVMWFAPITISTTPVPNPRNTALAMTPSGTAVATWVDGSGTGFSSTYNGATWSTPQIFASSVNQNSPSSISLDANGNALLLFQTPSVTPFAGTIFSAMLPLNGVWTVPEFVHIPASSVAYLIASLSDNGFRFAAWSEGVENFVYFASVEVAALPPAPPASIVGSFCKNKFGMQTDCVHIISWTPSPTPTVVAYEIRRNGVLIAVVPASELLYLDHDRCRQTDVYTVTAVDITGLVSTPVVVVIP